MRDFSAAKIDSEGTLLWAWQVYVEDDMRVDQRPEESVRVIKNLLIDDLTGARSQAVA